MSDLLPPFHKPMDSELSCHLANDKIAELEAENADFERGARRDRDEIERLKCCGNCRWYSSSLGLCNDDIDDELNGCLSLGECNPEDGCQFTPSRWSARVAQGVPR